MAPGDSVLTNAPMSPTIRSNVENAGNSNLRRTSSSNAMLIRSAGLSFTAAATRIASPATFRAAGLLAGQATGPVHLIQTRRVRLVQFPHRDVPLEPRIGGAVDRGHARSPPLSKRSPSRSERPYRSGAGQTPGDGTGNFRDCALISAPSPGGIADSRPPLFNRVAGPPSDRLTALSYVSRPHPSPRRCAGCGCLT